MNPSPLTVEKLQSFVHYTPDPIHDPAGVIGLPPLTDFGVESLVTAINQYFEFRTTPAFIAQEEAFLRQQLVNELRVARYNALPWYKRLFTRAPKVFTKEPQ